jgi:hypothetical protein
MHQEEENQISIKLGVDIYGSSQRHEDPVPPCISRNDEEYHEDQKHPCTYPIDLDQQSAVFQLWITAASSSSRPKFPMANHHTTITLSKPYLLLFSLSKAGSA